MHLLFGPLVVSMSSSIARIARRTSSEFPPVMVKIIARLRKEPIWCHLAKNTVQFININKREYYKRIRGSNSSTLLHPFKTPPKDLRCSILKNDEKLQNIVPIETAQAAQAQ